MYDKQRNISRTPRRRAIDPFDPQGTALGVAGEVIRKADQENPADGVLRTELAAHRDLSPDLKAEASRAVFAYYRWRGWLDEAPDVQAKLRRALELDGRFRSDAKSIAAAELQAKAVPSWLSETMEVSDAWLRTLQSPPKLWLRAKRGTGEALARKLGTHWKDVLPETPDAVLYEGGEDLFRRAEFHAGEFEIQDVSSQLVGLICAPKPGETWWDACAGEGGKTLHLSDLMENKGLIWASDRAAWRLQKLKRRTSRAGVFNYRAVAWDGGAKLPTKTKFDGVLVDAPCSGVGTWQRNPHARWMTTMRDVTELAEVQRRLLEHVAGSLKPGGRLIYSVCTLTRSETNEVAEAFTEAHPEFEPIPLENKISRAVNAATLTIWPQDFGGNGMFIAAWRKR